MAVVPLVRLTWPQHAASIFVEAGIGASYFQEQIRTDSKNMATRWNFYDTVAIGLQFGAQKQHEVSLRIAHQSNAGLRTPNPGINSAYVRWSAAF